MTMRELGHDHPHTRDCASLLALALSQQGKHMEAATLHATILAARKRVLVADHPSTVEANADLDADLDGHRRNAEPRWEAGCMGSRPGVIER